MLVISQPGDIKNEKRAQNEICKGDKYDNSAYFFTDEFLFVKSKGFKTVNSSKDDYNHRRISLKEEKDLKDVMITFNTSGSSNNNINTTQTKAEEYLRSLGQVMNSFRSLSPQNKKLAIETNSHSVSPQKSKPRKVKKIKKKRNTGINRNDSCIDTAPSSSASPQKKIANAGYKATTIKPKNIFGSDSRKEMSPPRCFNLVPVSVEKWESVEKLHKQQSANSQLFRCDDLSDCSTSTVHGDDDFDRASYTLSISHFKASAVAMKKNERTRVSTNNKNKDASNSKDEDSSVLDCELDSLKAAISQYYKMTQNKGSLVDLNKEVLTTQNKIKNNQNLLSRNKSYIESASHTADTLSVNSSFISSSQSAKKMKKRSSRPVKKTSQLHMPVSNMLHVISGLKEIERQLE